MSLINKYHHIELTTNNNVFEFNINVNYYEKQKLKKNFHFTKALFRDKSPIFDKLYSQSCNLKFILRVFTKGRSGEKSEKSGKSAIESKLKRKY
jgi:hypothetical protein